MNLQGQIEKLSSYDNGLHDLGLPVPIQTFLWSQIAPFIRPKLGKVHEATCTVIHGYFFLQEFLRLNIFSLCLSQFCQHAPGHYVSFDEILVRFLELTKPFISGIERGLQVIRESSGSEYPFWTVESLHHSLGDHRTVAFCASLFAACASLRCWFVAQSVRIDLAVEQSNNPSSFRSHLLAA